jgi:hypothetical protein
MSSAILKSLHTRHEITFRDRKATRNRRTYSIQPTPAHMVKGPMQSRASRWGILV